MPEVLQELALEPTDVLDRHPFQVTARAGPERDDLLLDRERGELRLLEQLDQS